MPQLDPALFPPDNSTRPKELEGLEPVPTKEWNPFEIDAADQDEDVGVSSPPPHATDLHNVTTASPQRGRKRPRTATTSGKMPAGVQRTFVTPPSGQWAVEGGQGIDSAEDFTLSVKRTQAASQGEDTSSSWLTQVWLGCCTVCYTHVLLCTRLS